jgi:hypothetical protein
VPVSVDQDRCACGVALEGRLSHAYNEEAFRHLLAVERRRIAHSRRSFLLVLVTVRKQPRMRSRIAPAAAAAVFSGLCASVREVDFTGWFRAGRVAGAVLTQGADHPTADVTREIGQRITETLRAHLGPDVARHLHVRILQLRAPEKLTP